MQVPEASRSNGRTAVAGFALLCVNGAKVLYRDKLSGLIFDSLPPTSMKSAAPRRRIRSASPIASTPAASLGISVLLGPWASYRIVAWHAGMFGRYFSIHMGGISGTASRPYASMFTGWRAPLEQAL